MWRTQILPKCIAEQQKLPQLLNKAMEEQSTNFICLNYQGKQNGRVFSTNERCMQQLGLTKILPVLNGWGKQQITSKIAPTFECSDGETIHSLHLYNLPWEA